MIIRNSNTTALLTFYTQIINHEKNILHDYVNVNVICQTQ